MNYQVAMTQYLAHFIHGLEMSGVSHAVVCPGSRSTPLSIMLSRNPTIRNWVLIDERSAAFFALGLAKSLSQPVVLVSTSGTAPANFYPAIIEAEMSGIPLIILTADRPVELRDSGAAQTIDQIHLYGRHVKWFQDMPIPEELDTLYRFAFITAQRAFSIATAAPRGPVHLNFPLREPLLPLDTPLPLLPLTGKIHSRNSWAKTDITPTFPTRGLIVAGPGEWDSCADSLFRLSEALQWPIFADPLSNLRQFSHPHIIRSYDNFIQSPEVKRHWLPETVLRVGAIPTSKPLNLFTAQINLMVIPPSGHWSEPNLQGAIVLNGEPCQILNEIAQINATRPSHPQWLSQWVALDRHVRESIDSLTDDASTQFEGRLFSWMQTWEFSQTQAVMVGSSMPVRDLDQFTFMPSSSLHFFANRGTNGIDGNVSTALGIAASSQSVILILGDLAFYHDMNGLLAASLYPLNALIIVINNQGGGIFSFLPQSRLAPTEFERIFGTPHSMDFSGAATLYGAQFRSVTDFPALTAAISDWQTLPGLRIIEWKTQERARNVTEHRQLRERIEQHVATFIAAFEYRSENGR